MPRSIADYPRAIDEDVDAPEVFHDAPQNQKYLPIIDHGDIHAMLDRDIAFYSRPGFDDLDAQYFNPDDLCMEYDYPRGIDDDDEEEEDSYLRDPDLRMIFAQHGWRAAHEEEEMTNAQYFDALELYGCEPTGGAFSSDCEEDEADSDFEIEDTFGPYTGLAGLSSAVVHGLQGQRHGVELDDRAIFAPGHGHFDSLFDEELYYSGLDEYQTKNLDVQTPKGAWAEDFFVRHTDTVGQESLQTARLVYHPE